MVARIHHAIDRGYRGLVEALPRRDLLNTLCLGLADALSLELVILVRQDESGTLECEAASREAALWAELVRLPERWDGGLAGDGPASRALRAQAPVQMTIDDPGFVPWRKAARDDGILLMGAAPFDTEEGAWVLMFCEGDAPSDLRVLAEDPGLVAMQGCSRLIDLREAVDWQRLLAASRESSDAGLWRGDSRGRR